MPNHVINEVVFRNVTAEQRAAIIATVSNERAVSFEVLLPIPLNQWLWSAGTKHEKAFPGTALDWCRDNWSTKWDAYGLSEGGRYESVAQTDDSLTLTFQTAWNAPMGWLCALFNKHNLPIEYSYLSEGNTTAFVGSFTPETGAQNWGAQWDEKEADEATTRRMHMLLWGVEEFPADDDE